MGGVGGIEHLGPLGPHTGGGAEVDRRRCAQADAGMAMGVVVVNRIRKCPLTRENLPL
jgi:hypothetical protein